MLKNIIYIKETAYHSGCNHLQNQSHSHLNNKPLYTHICLLHQTLSKEDELKTFYIKNLSCDKDMCPLHASKLSYFWGIFGFWIRSVNVQHDCVRQWSRLLAMDMMWLVFPWLWNFQKTKTLQSGQQVG